MSLHQQEKIVNSQTEPVPLATMLHTECTLNDEHHRQQPNALIKQRFNKWRRQMMNWFGLKISGLVRMLTINFELKLNLIHMLSSLLKDVVTLLS